jgi:hypothetical protein
MGLTEINLSYKLRLTSAARQLSIAPPPADQASHACSLL